MFQTSIDVLEENHVTRYRLMELGMELSYGKILDLWQKSHVFRSYFISLLANSPFDAYRWETPVLDKNDQDRPFEFVLINTPSFSLRPTDHSSFASYFTQDQQQAGIVAFNNLNGDATLIVPSPRAQNHAYGHLAAFIRHAPLEQVHALWKVVGQQVSDRLPQSPIWLNTAGGGVAWLHLRLDSQPKYYRHLPYAQGLLG